MKKYKENKNHVLGKMLIQIFLVFAIATASIVLYDMYINIEIDEGQMYNSEKLSKEISTKNIEDISSMLENSLKSVVRNIKNRKK